MTKTGKIEHFGNSYSKEMIYVVGLNWGGDQVVEEKEEIKVAHGIKHRGNPIVNLVRDRCPLMSGSGFQNGNLWHLYFCILLCA